MRTRVLILGGTGMLGHKLVQVLGADPELEVHCTTRRPPPEPFRTPEVEYHAGVDLGEGAHTVRGVLEAVRPEFVVNAVGAIKQKDLDSQVDDTFLLNGTLPHLLALLNPVADSRVIQVSTDCVFKGDVGNYDETWRPDAEDLYGRSKACGEIDYGRHLTLRTSIVGFELHGHLSLLSWFFSQPRGATLRGFVNAVYSGLPTRTLSRTIHDVVKGEITLTGLYHVASEPIDKFELLQRLDAAFDLGHRIEPDPSLTIDRSLNDTRFREATSTERPAWDELVEELKLDFQSYPYGEIYEALRARQDVTR